MKTKYMSGSFIQLVLCLAIACTLCADPVVPVSATAGVRVSGLVYNAVLQQPAVGIPVKLYYGAPFGTPSYDATSAADGSVSFMDIPSGFYVMLPFPPSGYIGTGKGINVGSSNVENVPLTLIKRHELYYPPNGSKVEALYPKLCWEPIPQAVSYRLEIKRDSDKFMIENPLVTSNCYTVQGPLVNNEVYSWVMTHSYNAAGISIGTAPDEWLFTYKTDPNIQAINMNGDTTLSSWDETISFSFPGGSFSSTGNITYQHDNTGNSGFMLLGTSKAYTLNSTVPLSSGAEYQVSISYSDYDLGSIDPDTLALYYWNNSTSQWVIEPTSTLDQANHRILATPNHFSRWAVMGETHRIFLPITRK